jgi:hypothetical protein
MFLTPTRGNEYVRLTLSGEAIFIKCPFYISIAFLSWRTRRSIKNSKYRKTKIMQIINDIDHKKTPFK